MEEAVAKIWKVSSFTFVLESCSKKVVTLNAHLAFPKKKSAINELILVR